MCSPIFLPKTEMSYVKRMISAPIFAGVTGLNGVNEDRSDVVATCNVSKTRAVLLEVVDAKSGTYPSPAIS